MADMYEEITDFGGVPISMDDVDNSSSLALGLHRTNSWLEFQIAIQSLINPHCPPSPMDNILGTTTVTNFHEASSSMPDGLHSSVDHMQPEGTSDNDNSTSSTNSNIEYLNSSLENPNMQVSQTFNGSSIDHPRVNEHVDPIVEKRKRQQREASSRYRDKKAKEDREKDNRLRSLTEEIVKEKNKNKQLETFCKMLCEQLKAAVGGMQFGCGPANAYANTPTTMAPNNMQFVNQPVLPGTFAPTCNAGTNTNSGQNMVNMQMMNHQIVTEQQIGPSVGSGQAFPAREPRGGLIYNSGTTTSGAQSTVNMSLMEQQTGFNYTLGSGQAFPSHNQGAYYHGANNTNFC